MKTNDINRFSIIGKPALQPDREVFTTMLKEWRQRLGYFSIFAAIPAFLGTQVEARIEDADIQETFVGQTTDMAFPFNTGCSKTDLLKSQSEFRLPHQPRGFDLVTEFTNQDDCPGFIIPGGNYTAAAPYEDSGDTTGANDTVTRTNFVYYCYYPVEAQGPDHIYSFRVTGRGPNPRIQVRPTSANYRPLIYIQTNSSGSGCPSGTGNQPCSYLRVADASSPGSSATMIFTPENFLPLNVPLYLFVDSSQNDANGSGGYKLLIQDITIAPTPRVSVFTRPAI